MKRILTSLVLVASVYSFAQVSISGKSDDAPQATLDVKAINGKTNGILVPRVSKADADNMPSPQVGSDIEESTLIYVTGNVSEEATKYATEVKTNGFYYFKGGKWVKLGSSSDSGDIPSRGIKTTVYKTSQGPLSGSAWGANAQDPNAVFLVVLEYGFEGVVNLPNPADFKDRTIALQNISGSPRSFGATYSPENIGSIGADRAMQLTSDGSAWYVSGGL